MGTLMGGCAGHSNTRSEIVVMEDSIPLPEEVLSISNSIKNGDAESLASKTLYPLERPYPLKNIEDSAQMVAYFPTLVDDSLKNVMAEATRQDWSEAGWRGWTLDSGQYLWISDGLYEFPYLSKKEIALLKREKQRDLETLPEDIRKGWTPEYCLVAMGDHTIYRIDSDTTQQSYRLLIYPKGEKLRQHPRHVFKGKMERQGTEQNRVYDFSDGQGSTIEFAQDDTGEGLSIIYNSKGKEPVSIEVEPTYWLDHTESE